MTVRIIHSAPTRFEMQCIFCFAEFRYGEEDTFKSENTYENPGGQNIACPSCERILFHRGGEGLFCLGVKPAFRTG